jgi:chemotaxis protein methyltransferase CheR
MSHTARVTDRSAFRQVQDLMRIRCGVVIADDQDYLLDSRLMPVARQLGALSVSEVVHRAVNLGEEDARLAVIDAMTTHETFFFRDATFWTVFEQQVLGPLLKKNDVVHIWSGACSTGQEPYSIAMLVRERWPDDAHRVRIVATDVSPLSVQRARHEFFAGATLASDEHRCWCFGGCRNGLEHLLHPRTCTEDVGHAVAS